MEPKVPYNVHNSPPLMLVFQIHEALYDHYSLLAAVEWQEQSKAVLFICTFSKCNLHVFIGLIRTLTVSRLYLHCMGQD
jgi:hypothetical protein